MTFFSKSALLSVFKPSNRIWNKRIFSIVKSLIVSTPVLRILYSNNYELELHKIFAAFFYYQSINPMINVAINSDLLTIPF